MKAAMWDSALWLIIREVLWGELKYLKIFVLEVGIIEDNGMSVPGTEINIGVEER